MLCVLTGLTAVLTACGGGSGGAQVAKSKAFIADDRFACQAQLSGTGAFTGEHLGWSVDIGGDWDGDRIFDIVASGGHRSPTRVRLYSGDAGSLAADDSCLVVEGIPCAPVRGAAVQLVSDLDMGGRDDLVIGVPFDSFDPVTAPESGAVYVFLSENHGCPGASAPLRLDDADLVIRARRGWSRFGFSIESADVDGDGRPDLICGAPGNPEMDPSYPGEVYTFLNPFLAEAAPTELTTTDADEVVGGLGPSDRFGWALTNAGELDGSTGDEVLATAIQATHLGLVMWDYHGSDTGYARLLGFGVPGALVHLDPPAPGPGEVVRMFGYSATSLMGDLDGDGFDDLAVGATDFGTTEEPLSGAVYLYSGLTGALISGPITPEELLDNSRFGTSLVALGDDDGDGLPDFAAGAPGTRHLPSELPVLPAHCDIYDVVGSAMGLVLALSGADPDRILARFRGADGSDQDNGKPRFGWAMASGMVVNGSFLETGIVAGALGHTANGLLDPDTNEPATEVGSLWSFALHPEDPLPEAPFQEP